MGEFEHIQRCMDLTEADLRSAKAERALAKDLLRRMTQVARPNTGAAKVLLVCANVAQADWFEGGMRVELGGDQDVTVLDLLSELGGGYSERVLPTFIMRVPLEEIRRAVRLQPKFILPLRLKHDRKTRIVLAVKADERFSSLPPPVIEVGPFEISPPFASLQVPGPVSEGPRNVYFPKADPTISFEILGESEEERPTRRTRMVPLPPARLAQAPPRPTTQPEDPHPGRPGSPKNIEFSQFNKKGLMGKKSNQEK